jgi:uncharacterized membrane protein YphA (DoxX/SURF4 family)
VGVLAWIVGLVLAIGFLTAGLGKLRGMAGTNAVRERLGVSGSPWRTVGGLEVLGAVGVFLGLLDDGNIEWIGVLAALGLIVTMIGAVVFHARAGDPPREMVPPIVLLVLAALYIILLAAR